MLATVSRDVFLEGNGGVWGAVARYGVATVIALGLVGFLVTKVDAGLAETLEVVRSNGTKMDSAYTNMTSFVQHYQETSNAQLRVLRQTCLNTATTDTQRMECVK